MNILCSNKKAAFRYTLIKKLEAGIALEGWEVKSLKQDMAKLVRVMSIIIPRNLFNKCSFKNTTKL